MSAGRESGPVLGVAVSAIMWGLWWLPLRHLETLGLAGDWASVALYVAGALALAPLVITARLAGGGAWARAALVGILFGGALVMWNHALLTGEVVRVMLLFYLAPLWATVLGVLFLKERLGRARALALALGLAGAAVVLGIEDGLPLPREEADWMGLLSGMLFAAASLAARLDGGGRWKAHTFAAFAFAIAVAGAFALSLTPAPAPSASTLSAALPFLVMVTVLWYVPSIALLLWGAGRLSPGRLAIILLLEIVAAAVSAALLADEPFGARHALGCVLIILAGLADGIGEARLSRPRAGA